MLNKLTGSLLITILPLFIIAQIPTGSVAEYPLNVNANDINGAALNGTLSGTSNTTSRFGTANTAQAFTSGSSSGTLPLAIVTAMQNDFSIGFWFKTNMTGPSGTQWYNGASLVDAEVGGVANDWGITLIDGGKVCFGVGSPDITIKSSSSVYNNNAWHFVTATRDKTAGSIVLYVDGVAVNSTAGINTGTLNAPSVIGLGRSSAVSSGNYTGSLDDIITYSRVLTPAEVSNLFVFLSATALPVKWVSFTVENKTTDVVLKWEIEKSVTNDFFEVEDSRDGLQFSVIGKINNSDISQAYSFTQSKPAAGTHYYRIKQSDKDGRFAYSKTLIAQVSSNNASFYLQTNPVNNMLTLINSAGYKVQRLEVSDMSGKIISNKNIQSNSSIIQADATKLLPGFYVLRVFTINGQYSLSMIKQ